jgi:hypothetical protein
MPSRRRVRFRPPGVKPGTRIGPLGPFRGRLGIHWVIAPLVVGALLLIAVWLLLVRGSSPGGAFEPVGPAASFAEGTARQVNLPGIWVGRAGGRLFAVIQEDGCALQFCRLRYVDCRGATYGLDGAATTGSGGLDLLPLTVTKRTVYVDPAHPVNRTPAPAPAGATPGACP